MEYISDALEEGCINNRCIITTEAPSAIGPYSQGMRTGKLIFISGQLPIDAASGELIDDIKEATKKALENIKAILNQTGATMADVVKTTVFLRDMNDFTAMNEIYATFFPSSCPARSAVQITRLPKDAVIEIEAIAVINAP